MSGLSRASTAHKKTIVASRPSKSNPSHITADGPACLTEQSANILAALKTKLMNLLPIADDAVMFTISYDFITRFSGCKREALNPYQRALAALYFGYPEINKLYDTLAVIQTAMEEPPMNRIPDFLDLQDKGKHEGVKEWLAEQRPENTEGDDPAPWFLAETDVQYPDLFPIKRILNLQYQYPSAKILAMQSWHDVIDDSVMVVAQMANGPYTDILINDQRHIAALGLDKDPHDKVELQPEVLRIGETFTITLCDKRDPNDLNSDLIGELRSARHAFLHWLDVRGVADPHLEPYRTEIQLLAKKLNRQALDVWNEVTEYWRLEHGRDGQRYRRNRKRYLGEDPQYSDNEKEKEKRFISPWG